MGNLSEKTYKYALGEYVTYRKAGICQIVDITVKNFVGQGKSEYYVLSSVYDSNTTVFVPVDSALENEMKKMLTVDEIHNIIDSSKNVEDMWVDNCRERAAIFDEIVNSGDKVKMLWLIKKVSDFKTQVEEQKKKMKAYDTRYLVMAENIISSDFAFALNIPKKQVMEYVRNYLNK